MVSLSDIQIGSIVLNMIEGIPSYISGCTLWNMVDMEVFNAEQYTGNSIGITAIAEMYQPAIISLTASSVLKMMEMQGADVSSISLGDFSISKGANSSSSSTSQSMREDGLMKLDNIGAAFSYYKSNG